MWREERVPYVRSVWKNIKTETTTLSGGVGSVLSNGLRCPNPAQMGIFEVSSDGRNMIEDRGVLQLTHD